MQKLSFDVAGADTLGITPQELWVLNSNFTKAVSSLSANKHTLIQERGFAFELGTITGRGCAFLYMCERVQDDKIGSKSK